MKKSTYLVIAAAAFSMIACTGGKKAGYVVTGTVEGAANGDTVFLQKASERNLVKLDTAIIENGKFTFEGVQDSAINRHITCQVNGEPLIMDFFLENGEIDVKLAKDNNSATGTPNNDILQGIKNEVSVIFHKMDSVPNQEEYAKLEEQYTNVLNEAVQKNITNPVGVHLFKQAFYNNSTDENAALLQQIPANLQSDKRIMEIKEITEKQKKTAVGTKFIDFEMLTPEGKAVKLSDYVGKGKVVLVDFWASWCGPCRKEMPNLVEAYAKYKGKNFEIVGVSLDQDGAAWKESIKKLNMTWPQMSDLKFWQSEGAQLYAVNSIPHTVLIDGEGTIIARGLHGEELMAKINEVVK